MTITYFILKHCRYAISFFTKKNPDHDLIVEKFFHTEEYIRDKGWINFFRSYLCALTSNLLPAKYEADVGITVIIKNEAPYIKEWIEFHKLVGVEKFFIYDNDSTDNIKEVLQPYINSKEVIYTPAPGKCRQMPVYEDSIRRNRHKVRYMAIIDADEFILPLKHKTIMEFINYLEKKIGRKVDSLGINWLLHGFNGHYQKPEGLVCENFKKCDFSIKDNEQIKSITNLRSAIGCNHPHYCLLLAGSKIVNAKGEDISGFCIDPSLDEIIVHHYWTKSFEEYQARVNKGKADGNTPYFIDEFSPDYLSVDDDSSMDKYIKILKAKLQR